MRGMILLIVLAEVMAVACQSPIKLRVQAAGPASAGLRTEPTKGKPTVPTECATPCEIEVPPDSEQHLTLQSEGYYPANVTFSYLHVYQLTVGAQGAKSLLVVPMKTRSSTTSAAAAGEPSSVP